MSAFKVIETVNSPGKPGKTGDDRSGFDASAGTAWVLDGATDVTPLKPFPQAESGAAWVADALSARLMVAPSTRLDARAYWREVMADVRERAARESTIPLDRLPPEAWPIASGIWMRRASDTAEFGWMGDCLALELETGTIIGNVESVAQETEDSRTMATQTKEEQWEAARQSRVQTNSSDRPIFGLYPDRAAGMTTRSLEVRRGTEFVMMSDGFYRLIDPYRIFADGAGLAAMIRASGLSGAVEALRAFESRTEAADISRIKASDDACALWIELT